MKDIAWLDRKEYPFKSHYLDLPAGRMHYIDEGKGDPILMLHGSPTWSFMYRHLIKSLASDFRCLAPDHLGFGLSDKPEKWVYTPAAHAENLQIFIQSLQLKRITLVVHDYGGPIGLQYAIKHPENVARIVVLNSWLWPLNKDKTIKQASQFFGGIAGRFLYRYFNFSVQVLLPRGFHNTNRLTPALKKHYLQPLNKPAYRRGTWRFAQELLRSKEWFDQLWRHHAVLGTKPMLILWGRYDSFLTHPFLFKWRMHFLLAKIVELDAGHFLLEEKPEEISREIRKFLENE